MIPFDNLRPIRTQKDLNLKLQALKALLGKKIEENHLFFLLHEKASKKSLYHELAFLSVLAIGQGRIVFRGESEEILDRLSLVEKCYQAIGGLVGYHLKALEIMEKKPKKIEKISIKNPFGYDVREKNDVVKSWILRAMNGLEKVAFVYPIGGLGDRLNLKDHLGKPLPVATLSFNGRSLLEGLIRDLQGLEYLHYKLFEKQITIPVAFMTSTENDNEGHIKALCESKNWFFRPLESFTLFSQISVPVVTSDGNWSMKSFDEINLQPGGHGAIWHMALTKGVLDKFVAEGKEAIVIRQINNPICGLDDGILVFLGCGLKENKAFGFISCQRAEKAAEGVLVLVDQERISNIEYTDFNYFGISEEPNMWANTNILFANIQKILPILDQNPLPGLILNMKSDVPFISEEGKHLEVKGGRLESMMQNLSDSIPSKEVFVMFNERKKTISVTKRCYEEGKSPLETPVGAFADLMENAKNLLEICGFEVGKNVIFNYLPSLGPLYSVIKYKLRGGKMNDGSEFNLEASEVLIENLYVEGSLLIEAKNPLGPFVDGILRYSPFCGKCRLVNTKIENQGIERSASNVFWKNEIFRKEKCQIILEGSGEFVAQDITFKGNFEIVVPDGQKWTAFERSDGSIGFRKQKIKKPTWRWEYQILGEELVLFEDSISQRLSLQDKPSQRKDRSRSLIAR